MTGSRRVLFLSPQPFFEARGSPIRVGFDLRALSDLGYEVDLVCMPLGDDVDIPGVRIHRIANPLRVRRLPIGPSPVKALYDVLIFFKALGLLRRGRYAVVHGVEEAGALAVLLARRGRSKAVFEKHSDPASHRKGMLRNAILSLYARVEAFTIRRADAVIGTGPGLVQQARAVRPGVSAWHIMDIPSSLVEAEPARTAEARQRLTGGDPAVRLALYAGSFAVYQGIDLLFDAIPLVASAAPEVRFIIIGGSPEQIEERRRKLRQQGVEESVSFLGHLPPDELPDVLAAADLLLSPRRAGTNTPLKLLDYLKSGRAIVACDHPANRLILDESNACLVEADPPALARAIVDLLRDDERRRRLGAAGRKGVEQTYHYGEFKRRLDACYRHLKG